MKPYVIGIDFGSLSARAVLVEAATGRLLGQAEHAYPHGILPRDWFPGVTLPREAARQHPRDYLEALEATLSRLLALPGVRPRDIGGIGVDFTSSTVLPVQSDGTPLCFLPEFAREPRAYVKLWKDHTANWEARRMTEAARDSAWLAYYGGSISSEWMLPKIWETLRHAPQVYGRAARFVEAGDWIVWMLTGRETRSSNFAGAKSLWQYDTGYPPEAFFTGLDSRLAGVIGTKLCPQVHTIGSLAGTVDARGAALTGLLPGTPVAVSCSDAPSALPALGVTGPGTLALVVGTSGCHFLVDPQARPVPGICECIRDGAIPGLFAYEAGQASVGDTFAWFMENCLPEALAQEARTRGISPFALLDAQARDLPVGANGHLALDWWNGSRCICPDPDLRGVLVGLTLKTKPAEIYRALLESMALGTRAIAENYRRHGLPVHKAAVTGGIARKNPLLMQIYADCLGLPLYISAADQCGALGSAIFAATAAGLHPTLDAAVAAMAPGFDRVYTPDPTKKPLYDRLYARYTALCRFFSQEELTVDS